MSNKTKKNVSNGIKFFLLFVIVFNIGTVIWQYKGKYTSSDYWERYPTLRKMYYDSIYANKNGTWMPDESLYAFNGGALLRGENPILVNPEVPPTGKYLVGLSALLFNNENIIILISGILSLVFVFLLGKQIFYSSITPLIPPALLSFEPIFLNQFIYTPLLDIIHLLFLLTTFYFFNRTLGKKHTIFLGFTLTMIFFGLFISTKFFGVGIPVVIAFYTTLLLQKNFKAAKIFTITFPISILILLMSYIRVLMNGYPLMKFLGIQKWIFLYNKGHLQFPLSIWPLILFNKWHVWWGDIPILAEVQWRISWPIITVVSLLTILLYVVKKFERKIEVEVLMIWIITYLLFLSFGNASARYLVILIPILYIVSVFGIERALYKYIK